MKRSPLIVVLLLAAGYAWTQPVAPLMLTAAPSPAVAQGPCDILAAAGTPCVAAHNFARKSLTSYVGSFYQLTGTNITEIYDQMNTSLVGNNLVVNGAFGKSPAPLGWTTPPSGVTVAIARIVPGQGYYAGSCCNPGFTGTINMPKGNSAITMYMVVEDTSEGGEVSGCCGSYNDGESPQRGGPKGYMFGLAWSTGGMGVEGSGTGPWPGLDLELGVWGYGPTPTAKYLTILGKYDPTTGTMTLKSGDATQGKLATLYSGPLPKDYTVLNLEGGLSLGGGGDASNSPINFIEGGIVAAATTDATDDALQANIVSFYGQAQ
jgi:hypothetical protein